MRGMQLWFARSKEVTFREQLVTQIVLGILSDDLRPGQRLPSTRELARRFRLHANTVSAGYRELEQKGWVEFRHGSGVYVCAAKPEPSSSPALVLDQLIADLFRSARKLGVPQATVRSRLLHWLNLQPPDHFVLIEPDKELARIIASEMQSVLRLPVKTCDAETPDTPLFESAIPVVLPNKAKVARKALPQGIELIVLQVRSAPDSLEAWLPAPSGALLGIASRCEGFLKMARAMLIAAGFHPDGLVLRDARKPHWPRGLEESVAVVCDSLIAAELPKTCRAIPFPILAEASLADLRRCEETLRSPLLPAV
ncbi:MAG TPA: GntR family transcriptional regulator [Candidatus Acidoferrales bacterium]|nr:GntR family transcriptional regulator [Candidatus Acidoferrales bacterium]